MRRQLRWYGASPLHLLAMLACFGLAGYAAARLVPSQPLGVIVWFLGAVIGHDLLLVPLYSLADRSVMAAIRHREPRLPAVPWINYVRVPAALSGLLLLVWFPLILRLHSSYHASTTLSADPYVWHWLAVTGALFLLSAVAFALRLRRNSQTAPAPERSVAAPERLAPAPEPRPDPAPERPDPARGGSASDGEVRTALVPGRPDEAPDGTNPDLESGDETGSGQVSRADHEPGQEPGVPKGERDAGESARAQRDPGHDKRESPPGRPQPAGDPDTTSAISDQPGGQQHEVRPGDRTPPTQPGGARA